MIYEHTIANVWRKLHTQRFGSSKGKELEQQYKAKCLKLLLNLLSEIILKIPNISYGMRFFLKKSIWKYSWIDSNENQITRRLTQIHRLSWLQGKYQILLISVLDTLSCKCILEMRNNKWAEIKLYQWNGNYVQLHHVKHVICTVRTLKIKE